MSNMNGLQVANHSHKMNVDFHTSRLNNILTNGINESEMSAEDMKHVIISLVSIVKSQERMIQALVSEVNIVKEERNETIEKFLENRK